MMFKKYFINSGADLLSNMIKIFSSKIYPFYFSLFYAIIWVFRFYPGILYSDSVGRWNLAIDISNYGFANIQNFSNHHPVIPSIFQSLFYNITHEIGLYIFVQIFAFAFTMFYFIHIFVRNKLANVLASLLLLIPINVIYALFHSFDSMFSIVFLLFVSILLRLHNHKMYFPILLLLFFFLVSIRLNAIVLLVPTMLYLGYLYRSNIKITLMVFPLFVFSGILPFLITANLHMKSSNSWIVGFAWEYANLATKSSDKSNQEYLTSVGANIENIKSGICYNGIWCGNERTELIDRIANDNAKSLQLAIRYVQLAKQEPYLFFNEKLKYIKSLFGLSKPISNAEIGRWREQFWVNQMASLGFQTTSYKEQIIDDYFKFCNKNTILFKPYLLFVTVFLLVMMSFVLFSKEFSTAFFVSYFYSLFYYSTFIITSQNHEFRYFFPSFLLLEGLIVVFAINLFLNYCVIKCKFMKNEDEHPNKKLFKAGNNNAIL